MIPASAIKNIIKELADYISITFIRDDQIGNVPAYPYMSYKMLSTNQESAHQDSINVSENSTDSTSADITRYEKVEEIISINFYDKNRVDRIYTYATQAIQWFKSVSGRQACKENYITVRLINTQIQDRSIFQEAFWENRIGFDLRFDYCNEYTQTIEAIETIEITPTIDGDEKTIITIQES